MAEKKEATLATEAESFIGSFVSLVTKSNIKYQGFVFYLDPKHSTIGIRVPTTVKSSGTNSRRKDGSQVPPSEKVDEYLYFKGTDIKGLDVKSPRPAQSTLNVLDDPAIIQTHFSPPASSPVSLSSSGAVQMTNVSHNVQSVVDVPYLQGNHTSHSSIAGPLASSLPPLILNNSTPAFPTYWPSSSLPQDLVVTQPSQQQTNSSLTNVRSVPNSPNVVEPLEPYHSLIPPISPGVGNELHAPQKSPVCSSSGIPSMNAPSDRGSQFGFPLISPGVAVPQMSTIGSPSSLSSVPPSSATSSQNGFPLVPPLSATYSLIPPLTPGPQSGLSPLLSVTGYSETLRYPPPSPVPVNGFSLATPSPAAHSNAGLFSVPAFWLPSSLPSSTSADLKTQAASSSSTSALVNTGTPSVKEVATPVPGPVAPSSGMFLSVKPIVETRSDFIENNPLQPSDPLLQQEQIRLPSSHNDYDPVQYYKTYHSQRSRDEKDKDVFQDRPSYCNYGKGRAKLPKGAGLHAQYGYKTHAKARGHEVGRDRLHGACSHHNYEKGRGYLKDIDALQSGRSDWGYGNGRDNLALLPVEKFTEDFNFEAMNAKFNKEEVWGLLGQSTVAESEHTNEDGAETNIRDSLDAEEDGPVKFDNTPVYCKDDFFDTLSSNTRGQQSGRRRLKFSERMKLDSETFGEIQRHQQGHGIHRGGGSQGSYWGRGYDHRGRGH